jgi:hypothetical protein
MVATNKVTTTRSQSKNGVNTTKKKLPHPTVAATSTAVKKPAALVTKNKKKR